MKSFQPNSLTKLNTTIQTLDTKNVVLQKHNEEYVICLKGHQEHLSVVIEINQWKILIFKNHIKVIIEREK